jgi:hypothetical protein
VRHVRQGHALLRHPGGFTDGGGSRPCFPAGKMESMASWAGGVAHDSTTCSRQISRLRGAAVLACSGRSRRAMSRRSAARRATAGRSHPATYAFSRRLLIKTNPSILTPSWWAPPAVTARHRELNGSAWISSEPAPDLADPGLGGIVIMTWRPMRGTPCPTAGDCRCRPAP